jgi:hypothetical protein
MEAQDQTFQRRLDYYDLIVEQMRTHTLRPDQAAERVLPGFLKTHGAQPWAARPVASDHARTMPGGLSPEALPGKEGDLVAPGHALLWLAMAALDVPGASLFEPEEQITADIAHQVATGYHPRAVFTAPIVTPQRGPGHKTGDQGAASGLIRAVCFDGAWLWGLGELPPAFARELSRGAYPHLSVLLRARRDVGGSWYLVNLLATAEEPGTRGLPGIQEQLLAALGRAGMEEEFGAALSRTHKSPVIARTFQPPTQEATMSEKTDPENKDSQKTEDPKAQTPEAPPGAAPKPDPKPDPKPVPPAAPNPPASASPAPEAPAPQPVPAPPPKGRTYPMAPAAPAAPGAAAAPAPTGDPQAGTVQQLSRTVEALTGQVEQLMEHHRQAVARETRTLEGGWSTRLEEIDLPAGDRKQQLEVLRAIQAAGGDPEGHLAFLERNAQTAGREQLTRAYLPPSEEGEGGGGTSGAPLAVPPELRIPGREAEVTHAVHELHRTARKDGTFDATALLGGTMGGRP